MWVIMRDDGAFVARSPITGGSYTGRLQNAETYHTKEAAERDLCPENERVVSVESLLHPRSHAHERII